MQMIIFFELILIFFLLFIIAILLYSMVRGAPYAPIGEEKTKAMLSLLKIKPGEKAVDIGSGDGRIVIALARQGAEAHGYELNPLLVYFSKQNIKKAGLEKNAFIHWADFWRQDLSKYDVITIYLTGHIMKNIEHKLQTELKKGGRIAVNYFRFPHWKHKKQLNTIYLYIK